MIDTGICLLNVDDYVPGRFARTRILEHAGFTVFEAGTGREALEAVSKYKPALVLLDVNLPDTNGLEICKKIKSNPETEGTTILHISASSVQDSHLVDGLDAGADAYLVEPVDAAVLVATVRAFLRARRAETALRRSNEELESFAYRAAHDLNEPLRGIVVHAQLLELNLRGQLSPETQKSMEFVLAAGLRMRDLISRLLRYAQVARVVDRAAAALDSETMLTRALANLEEVIQDSGAVITHDPLPVVAADAEIEEIFQNLIGNAIKYRRPGVAPQIHLSARPDSGGWRFSVQDNGIGIDAVDHESIFHIFHRLHGHQISGSGIGLAIAKKIVVAHGGAIWVESTPGVGSTFYFTLPAELADKSREVLVER